MKNQIFLTFPWFLMLHKLTDSTDLIRIRNLYRINSKKSPDREHVKKLNDVNSSEKLIMDSITGKITNIDWTKRVSQASWPLHAWLSNSPTNRIKCQIFCRSGYHLQIRRNGFVSGTLNPNSKYTLFEIQSFGPSIIRIKSIATGQYLIMRRNGCIRGSDGKPSRCLPFIGEDPSAIIHSKTTDHIK